MPVDRELTLQTMNAILARQGKAPVAGADQALRGAGFRSLDFSELALRLEAAAGRELNFDAAPLRRIATVGDVLEFFEKAFSGA